jgi:hypothetical protein
MIHLYLLYANAGLANIILYLYSDLFVFHFTTKSHPSPLPRHPSIINTLNKPFTIAVQNTTVQNTTIITENAVSAVVQSEVENIF